MKSRLIKTLWRPETLTGVAVHIGSPGSFVIHACTISVFNNKLDIGDKQTGLKNVLHFSKHYPKGPLALSITGKGVMTRQIEEAGQPEAQALQKVLPNANPDDFYVQLHQDDSGDYLSLMRRADADELVADFEGYGYTVVSLNLGGFAAAEVLMPEDKQLDEALLNAYRTAFQVLLLAEDRIEVKAGGFGYARQQAFARVKVMRLARLTGLAAGLLLILNFMFYQYYTAQVGKLERENKVTGDAAGQLRATEASILQKTELVESAGWMDGFNPAFIADRLLSLMPEEVTLQEFSINPVNKEIKRFDQAPVYRIGMVEVTGSCREANALNNWLIAIKTYDWVADCKIKNYLVSPESGRGIFTVHIQLDENEK
jgi:hypothetical protein